MWVLFRLPTPPTSPETLLIGGAGRISTGPEMRFIRLKDTWGCKEADMLALSGVFGCGIGVGLQVQRLGPPPSLPRRATVLAATRGRGSPRPSDHVQDGRLDPGRPSGMGRIDAVEARGGRDLLAGNQPVAGFGRVGISFQKVRLVEQLVDEVRLHSPVAQSVEMLHRVAEIGGAAGRGGVFVVAALVA